MKKEYALLIANENKTLVVEKTFVDLKSEYALCCSELNEAEVKHLASKYSLLIVHVASNANCSRVELDLHDLNPISYKGNIGVMHTEGYNDNILVFDSKEELFEGCDYFNLPDVPDLDGIPEKSDDEVYVYSISAEANPRIAIEPKYSMARYGYGNDNIHVALL